MLVDGMNRAFREPVVEASTGGARVTSFGRDVLRRYVAMEAKAARSVRRDLAGFRRLLAKAASPAR